jgi:hypothetical protein
LRIATVALMASLAVCASAQARVVLATSIDGVSLGMSDGEMDCYVGTIKRGHRYTDFYFEDGPSSMTAVIVGEGYT